VFSIVISTFCTPTELPSGTALDHYRQFPAKIADYMHPAFKVEHAGPDVPINEIPRLDDVFLVHHWNRGDIFSR